MKKPPRKRNRTPDECRADIRMLEVKFRGGCATLGNVTRMMREVQDEFRTRRNCILDAEAKRCRRPQHSDLGLFLMVSKKTGSPRVIWKRIVRHKRNVKSGRPWFTKAIPHRRRDEWVPKELARFAHPREFELVVSTEAQLANLRKLAKPYQRATRKHSIAAAQLKLQLAKLEGCGESMPQQPAPLPPTPRISFGSRPSAYRAGLDEDARPIPPQFKHPDGVL